MFTTVDKPLSETFTGGDYKKMKTTSCTENRTYAFDKAPRCGAKTKSNNGNPCRCPAMSGKARCRIHGGAAGSGAPRGNVNALKHGNTPAASKAFKRDARQAIQLNYEFLKELKGAGY